VLKLTVASLSIASLSVASLSLTALILTPSAADARRSSKPRPQKVEQKSDRNNPGKFDYYALTLSWSPDYCAAKGSQDPQQCGEGRKLGFVLHGLWPQNNQGWPQSCTNESLDPKIRQQFPDLYPSAKLYSHEWEKHGTCSGLTQTKYHELAQGLKNSTVIPTSYNQPTKPFRVTLDELKQSFVQANPGMSSDGIAATCSGSGRFLQEIMVCYGKDGQPGVCSPEVLRKSSRSCGQPDLLVRSVR
jgi:ribonuclease T2